MEFLVEFETHIPDGTPESEVGRRQSAEATAAVELTRDGHLVRLWNRSGVQAEASVVGLYRAGSADELDHLLAGSHT